MNYVDIFILIILGLSVIYGFYRGFVHTVLNVLCVVLSVLLSFTFAPKLSNYVQNNEGITSMFSTYTDSVARVGDFDLASTQVENMNPSLIDQVLQNVDLPPSISSILQNNLSGATLKNNGKTTVNDYVQSTVVSVAINILSYVLCFFVAYFLLSIVVSFIQHIFKFPILKQLDWLAGGIFGFLRGGLILYVIFLLMPILSTVIPLEDFDPMVAQSQFAPFFSSGGFFSDVINGKFF